MLKPMAYHKFKVWQTYNGSKKFEVITDSPFSAAESYALKFCKQSDFTVYFGNQHDNNTVTYYNSELGTIYVTEIKENN